MNEQLIKIGLESGMLNYVDNETPRHYFLSGHADEQDLEKFAQLIVKECVESLWTEECHTSDLAVEEYNRNSKKIKQHFGIGEVK